MFTLINKINSAIIVNRQPSSTTSPPTRDPTTPILSVKIPNEDNPTNLENSTFENVTLVGRVDVEGIESHLAIHHVDIL